jgi:hypothetical protein
MIESVIFESMAACRLCEMAGSMRWEENGRAAATGILTKRPIKSNAATQQCVSAGRKNPRLPGFS